MTGGSDNETHLKKRLQRLAADKSQLELLVDMMTRLGQASGLEDLVERSLGIIINVIGATNTILYYRKDNRFHYADAFGGTRIMDSVDAPEVADTFRDGAPRQIESRFTDTKMTYATQDDRAFTWVHPLAAKGNVFGVIKVEHTAYRMDGVHNPLGIFFNYLGHQLHNELHNVQALEAAYRRLEKLNAELESRVADRTRALEKAILELRRSEERFELAMKASQDGLFDWNVHTNAVYYSPGWKRILGYEEDELPDTFSVWEELTAPAGVARTWGLLRELMRGKRDRFETEFRMKHKAGHWVDILARAVGILDDAGNTARIVGTHVDISKLKAAEAALGTSEAKFQLAFQSAPMLMSISDLETGRYIDVNDAFVRATGYEREAAIGNTSVEIGFVRDRDRARMKSELLSKGSVHELELELTRADGTPLNCLYYGELITIEGQQRLLSIASDITDRKRMEEHIRATQKMESIGNLAGGIAHDFNNILFPIVGLSEMLVEDLPPDSPLRENAKEIFRAGKRGSDLVKQILAFSRQSEHRMMPVRIQTILKEVLSLARSTIPTYIAIETEIANDCGLVLADPTQIHQVAMNIITNAFHALENEGGTIRVALRQRHRHAQAPGEASMKTGRCVVLSISDDGPGIPPADIKRIFDPYFTTKEPGKGTGLGLAVVYGIVKEHGGEIRVRSEMGKGATFTMYLPLMDMPAADLSPATRQACPVGSERILLVDDEAPIAALEKQMLERLGYQVTACSSSLGALDVFKARPYDFDIVISDMSMPNMTGDQLARALRGVRPELPIIICTGFSERINTEKAESIGVSGFLMKPIIKADIAKMVRDVLDGAAGA